MTIQPSRLLVKLSHRLFSKTIDQDAFIQALINPRPLNPCILWCHNRPFQLPFKREEPRPEQPLNVDRLPLNTQPGKHALHEQGYYYCLDYSSVISASVLSAIPMPVYTVLDMCASPGGKSLFSWRSLSPKHLLCNEVIKKRSAALIANLRRCKAYPSMTLSLDSSVLAEQIPSSSDCVIVDAPCTGQSLLAKGGKADGCFHPVNINRNANRQKRILANSAKTVAPGGYLAYMTCAYSPEENEGIMEWFLRQFPAFTPVTVPNLEAFQSPLSDRPCYRVWPQSNIGAGGFSVLLHNTQNGIAQPVSDLFLKHSSIIRIEKTKT